MKITFAKLHGRQLLFVVPSRRSTRTRFSLQRRTLGHPAPLIVAVELPSHSKITSLRWDANAQAGRASLFSGDEQRLLTDDYHSTAGFWSSQSDEEAVWAKMDFIVGLRHFTPLDVHDRAILLSEARYRDFRSNLAIERAHQWAARLHLAAANSNPSGTSMSRRSQFFRR